MEALYYIPLNKFWCLVRKNADGGDLIEKMEMAHFLFKDCQGKGSHFEAKGGSRYVCVVSSAFYLYESNRFLKGW